MTFPRAIDLMGAWKRSPPVHWMIAGYIGWHKGETTKKSTSSNDWSQLAEVVPISRGKKRSLEEMVAESTGMFTIEGAQ